MLLWIERRPRVYQITPLLFTTVLKRNSSEIERERGLLKNRECKMFRDSYTEYDDGKKS